MLNFLWWFLVGPIVGWIVGRLLRSSHNGWIDALVGLVGAILVGTAVEFAGFSPTYTAVDACISGGAGALIVTFFVGKVIAKKSVALPKPSSSRSSYTSYKSRIGK